MPIDYTDLFTPLGQLVKKINTYKGYISTFETYITDTLAVISAQEILNLADDVPETYHSLQDRVSSWITAGMKEFMDKVLTHPTLVTDNLPIGNVGGADEVLPLLIKDMIAESETVKECTVTIGSPTYALANAGSVKLFTTAILDGFNAPASYASPNPDYAGILSELAQDDQTITLTCTQDSESGGADRGAETFLLAGNATNSSYTRNLEGLGETNINVGNTTGAELLENGGFDDWSSTAPANWNLVDGDEGTDFEEAPAGLRGTSGLLVLDATVDFEFNQTIPAASLDRRRGYVLVAFLKKNGTTGVVDVTLKEGATTIASLAMDVATAASGWNIYTNPFVVPDQIDEDWILTVAADDTFDGTPTVDDVMIIPLNYVGGIGLALVAVDEKIILGDKITFDLSNNNAGIFQTAFRRLYGVQLPSDGTPSINDSLATES